MAKSNSRKNSEAERKRSAEKRKQLIQFRSAFAKLSKLGLVKKRDARKIKPTRYMKNKIKRLDDVVTGLASSVKVDKATAARYKASGFFVFKNRVVVSKDSDERPRRDGKSGLIVLRKLDSRYPYEKVVMPYSITNIDLFLNECRKSPPDPQIFLAKKYPEDIWAFTFFGNNSLTTFPDIGLMGEHLERYHGLQNNPQEFQHLILYRVNESWANVYWGPAAGPGREAYDERNAARRAKDKARRAQRDNLRQRGRDRMEAKKETYAEQNARLQRDWYARQKERAKSDDGYAKAFNASRAAKQKARRERLKKG